MIRRYSRGLFQQHRSKPEVALFGRCRLSPLADTPCLLRGGITGLVETDSARGGIVIYRWQASCGHTVAEP
jgi:hypothetical protein